MPAKEKQLAPGNTSAGSQGQGENSLVQYTCPQRPLSLGVNSPELQCQALGRERTAPPSELWSPKLNQESSWSEQGAGNKEQRGYPHQGAEVALQSLGGPRCSPAPTAGFIGTQGRAALGDASQAAQLGQRGPPSTSTSLLTICTSLPPPVLPKDTIKRYRVI